MVTLGIEAISVFGLETPLRSEAEAGLGPRERLGQCVEATHDLFARLDG